jgi:hypothetical protein
VIRIDLIVDAGIVANVLPHGAGAGATLAGRTARADHPAGSAIGVVRGHIGAGVAAERRSCCAGASACGTELAIRALHPARPAVQGVSLSVDAFSVAVSLTITARTLSASARRRRIPASTFHTRFPARADHAAPAAVQGIRTNIDAGVGAGASPLRACSDANARFTRFSWSARDTTGATVVVVGRKVGASIAACCRRTQ